MHLVQKASYSKGRGVVAVGDWPNNYGFLLQVSSVLFLDSAM